MRAKVLIVLGLALGAAGAWIVVRAAGDDVSSGLAGVAASILDSSFSGGSAEKDATPIIPGDDEDDDSGKGKHDDDEDDDSGKGKKDKDDDHSSGKGKGKDKDDDHSGGKGKGKGKKK